MSSSAPTILAEILQQKAKEVAERKRKKPFQEVRSIAESSEIDSPRGFIQAIQVNLDLSQPAVIAEIKKASPSKGVIRENFNPAEIAQQYEKSGASCLSVLTDKNYFQGDESYLIQARSVCTIPVLRKDFIVDPYQVYETRALEADCVLLIVAAFMNNLSLLKELVCIAQSIQLDVLVEVHNEAELEMAMALPCQLIGINNRDLHTFNTDLQTTFRLQKMIPENKIIVTESGIHTSADVITMRDQNIHTFLVGEAFMRQSEPGEALKDMFF